VQDGSGLCLTMSGPVGFFRLVRGLDQQITHPFHSVVKVVTKLLNIAVSQKKLLNIAFLGMRYVQIMRSTIQMTKW